MSHIRHYANAINGAAVCGNSGDVVWNANNVTCPMCVSALPQPRTGPPCPPDPPHAPHLPSCPTCKSKCRAPYAECLVEDCRVCESTTREWLMAEAITQTYRAFAHGQYVRINQPSHRAHGEVGRIVIVAQRDGYWIFIPKLPHNILMPGMWLSPVESAEEAEGPERASGADCCVCCSVRCTQDHSKGFDHADDCRAQPPDRPLETCPHGEVHDGRADLCDECGHEEDEDFKAQFDDPQCPHCLSLADHERECPARKGAPR
jgi:hypothetical protein